MFCKLTAMERARACALVMSLSDKTSGRGELNATTMGWSSGVKMRHVVMRYSSDWQVSHLPHAGFARE